MDRQSHKYRHETQQYAKTTSNSPRPGKRRRKSSNGIRAKRLQRIRNRNQRTISKQIMGKNIICHTLRNSKLYARKLPPTRNANTIKTRTTRAIARHTRPLQKNRKNAARLRHVLHLPTRRANGFNIRLFQNIREKKRSADGARRRDRLAIQRRPANRPHGHYQSPRRKIHTIQERLSLKPREQYSSQERR